MPRDQIEVKLESDDFSCEHVQVSRLIGEEAISKLFTFDLEIVVTAPEDFDFDALPGANASVVFLLGDVELRRVHGMISSSDDLLESETRFRTYRLRLVPRAFRLTLVETQEVFLNLSVPDIIKQKLALVGLGSDDVEMRLLQTYPAREFVVQYKETDLVFVSRLAEHLGISFFFEHDAGHDRMIFTDHDHGFRPTVRAAPVLFRARGERHEVFDLERKQRLMPQAWVTQDYNYRTPMVDLTSTHEAPQGFAGGVVEYSGHHKTPDAGAGLARVRAEERTAATHFYTASSDVCELTAGATFSLEGHPRLDAKHPFLTVAVSHSIAQVVLGHGSTDGVHLYTNTLRLTEAARTYRPPREAKRPRIDGVLTGVIEPNADGQMGKIAVLDEQGRYTVRFYFDLSPLGQKPHSSHPVRMIQQHSGPDYGTHMPLKAGTEVLVVFVDGDPDRPLIVGSVHNPVTPTPVTIRNPSMHRIKTASGILIEMKDRF